MFLLSLLNQNSQQHRDLWKQILHLLFLLVFKPSLTSWNALTVLLSFYGTQQKFLCNSLAFSQKLDLVLDKLLALSRALKFETTQYILKISGIHSDYKYDIYTETNQDGIIEYLLGLEQRYQVRPGRG